MPSQDDLCFPQQATTQILTPNPTTEATQRQAGPNFFRDGENVQFMWAESISNHDFNPKSGALRIEVKTHQYINRTAQTHDSVMHQFVDVPELSGVLHFEICFFTETIFRVKYAGNHQILDSWTDDPEFPPQLARMLVGKSRTPSIEFTNGKDELLLTTESILLRVQKEPFRLKAFKKDQSQSFWQQRLSDLFTSDVIPTSITRHEGRVATFEAFTLRPDECLYGLGERFDSVSRIGRPVDFVNHDAIGTSNTRSYINVPFFWSTAGYGCFVNSNARTEWDLGRSEQGTVAFCTEEEFMDYFVIHGADPQEILRQYTNDLTGTSPVLPDWTFGLWLSRNSYESWEVVDQVIQKANKHRIPLDDIHLDTSWFKEDWNPDLIFDTIRFHDHESKMAELKKSGIHVSLWQYTFAPPRQDNSLFVEGEQNGYFGMNKNPDGSRGKALFSYPANSSGWKIDDAVIDFSNPATKTWYAEKISNLIKQGASAIKTDFGDCIPPDAYYANINGRRFQNLFSLVYNETVWNAIKTVDPETAIWARSGTAGSQRFPVHWGGDSQCSWSALQGTLKATLSIGLSGFAYFSHDIGGFIGKPESELYTRWAQLGLLGASHSRSHGAGNDNSREPWAFGDEALTIFRKFADLRYQLLPYIMQQCRDGVKQGLPLIRHLVLEWPRDRNVWHIENQYMLGDSLLVAPVLMPLEDIGETMMAYFPKGTWYDFWSPESKLVSCGEWNTFQTPALDSMAIWVRSGSMICYAQEGRLRTWGRAGDIAKIELYGNQGRRGASSEWRCCNGEDHEIVVQQDKYGRWTCAGDDNVVIHKYDD